MEMEQSDSRLYTGGLSQAALRILAALRSQSLRTRRNQNYSSYNRQMERFDSSQRATWREECMDRSFVSVLHRNSSETQSSQSSQASLSSHGDYTSSFCQDSSFQTLTSQVKELNQFTQESSEHTRQEEFSKAEFPSQHKVKAALCIQIPQRLPAYRASPWANSSAGIKSSFVLSVSPDEDGPDEMLFPTTEQLNSEKNEPQLSSCRTPPEKTDYVFSEYKRKTPGNIDSVRNEEDDVSRCVSLTNLCHASEEVTSIFKANTHEVRHLYPAQKDDQVNQSSDSKVRNPGKKENMLEYKDTGDKIQTTIHIQATEGHSRSPKKITLCDADFSPQMAQTVSGSDPLLLSESTALVHEDNGQGLDARAGNEMEMGKGSNCSPKKRCETNNQRAAGLQQSNSEDIRKSAEDSERKQLPAPTRPNDCVTRRSRFRPPLLCGNQQRHDSSQTTCESDRSADTALKLGQNCTSVTGVNMCVAAVQSPSHLTPLLPSLPLKRQREKLQDPHDIPKSKICLTWCPPKCKTPFSKAKKQGEGGICEMKKTKMSTSASGHPVVVAQESKTLVLPSHHTDTDTESGKQSLKPNSTNISSFKSGKHSLIKTLTDRKCFERVHEEFTATEPKIRSKASSCLTAALTSDTRVRDSDKMNPDEKMQMLKKAHEAKVLLLTLVHRDGTTQLDSEQKLTTTVCGLFVLMKSDIQCSAVEDSLGPDDSLMYLKLEQTPAWALQQIHHSQQAFTRDLLHLMLSSSELVVCYKAKDLLRTALQIYNEDLNWKQVAGCHIQDPQVSGWLLDAADPSSCFQSLLHKHFRRQFTIPAVGSQKVSQVISGLTWLLRLHLKLHSDLKNQRLWCLYTNMELKMIPVLAAMESHRIHVDKETLKKTSDFLGTKMKQLEQEAHQAAGQKFLLTSNTQLRTVLFEKLRLHERCENKKLPKTINKQQHSTSEAALLQLQDLHPLPKIILEYRQVHKIKSTFVDGILSCMMSKSYISSTWHQTSAVTGRISAKHPNFQALPRQPLQITRKQFVIGKEDETVTVHPRAMFVPREGWSFVAADFCQVELRLLAHLSSDPELLRIFSTPQADVFTMLASQWKCVAEGEVTSEDREHAKRIVYSVVYGAGRVRLSGILGVSAEQARQFQDSFLQTYRDVQEFIQRTIQQSHKQGFVLSIMGRRRTLPNINSPDWGIRMQAERQAVNFVVQGSAADLCKMAMIRIFNLISSSGLLTPRLIAQLHDELLYEVEDSQIQEFAALVKGTMESLQHDDHLGVHLKVPLKVAVSCGKSWGSMCDLSLPPTSSSSH